MTLRSYCVQLAQPLHCERRLTGQYLLVDDTPLAELLIYTSIIPDPVEDTLVPQQTVVPLCNPVALIWEVQEPTRHT